MLTSALVQLTGAISCSESEPYRLTFADATFRDATAAEILAATKTARLASIRFDARRIIDATYPAWRQQSAALGLYPADYVTQMQSDIASVIAASNAAEDAVDAAADIAAVDAVTPTWPTI